MCFAPTSVPSLPLHCRTASKASLHSLLQWHWVWLVCNENIEKQNKHPICLTHGSFSKPTTHCIPNHSKTDGPEWKRIAMKDRYMIRLIVERSVDRTKHLLTIFHKSFFFYRVKQQFLTKYIYILGVHQFTV